MEKWKLDVSLLHKNRLRDPYIDALKGAAILLVVSGHAILFNTSDFDNNIVFRIICSFQMPLFMFLSGYVIYGRIRSPVSIWLIDKFKRLVVPFLSWAIIMKFKFYNSDSFIQYFFKLYERPDRGLWFLWVLFLNYCILSAVSLSGKPLGKVNLLLTTIVVMFIPINVLGFPLVRWLFLFFAAGYILAEYRNKLPQWIQTSSVLFSGIFPFLVYFWRRTEVPSFNQGMSTIFAAYGIISTIPMTLINLSYGYLVAFAGISLVAQVLKKFEKGKLFLLLSWLGTCTLDIYVGHMLFLYGIGEGSLKIISSVIVAIPLSLALSFCLRQSKILSILFLGRK